MIEQHASPGVVGVPAGSPGSAGTSFNRWLEVQLEARRLTRRELAHTSGASTHAPPILGVRHAAADTRRTP